MSGFEWLSAAIEWFAKFIPHQVILNPAWGGVKFKRGHTPIACGPGIHWYLPLMSTFHEYPTARQAENLKSQTLMTSDGKTIIVTGMLVHEIINVVKFAISSHDGFTTLKELTLTAVHDVICQMTWDELKVEQQSGKLDTKLKNATKKLIEEYGVRVVKVMLTDMAPARVYRMVNSTSAE